MQKKRKGEEKMRVDRKAAVQIALLFAGAAMLCFGVWRGDLNGSSNSQPIVLDGFRLL